MKALLTTFLWGAVCCFLSVPALSQTEYDPRVTRVGDEFAVDVQTTHPYAHDGAVGVVFEKEFTRDNAGYVRLHFKNFDLAPGDYVEVYSPNTGESYVYAEGGKVIWAETRKTISDFWANAVWDNTAVVRLYAKDASTHYGFDIDVVAYGYSEARLAKIFDRETGRTNTVCGANDMDEAICHNGTEMYNKSRAVCRLLINGSSLCTGWLVGSEGHVMTNNHCIGSSSAAANTQFRFNYQYNNCNGTNAASQDIVASTSTLIKTNGSYDYTLVKLPVNPTGTYGYLSMKSSAPSVGDRIYIPQHPGGVRKKLAVTDDQSPYAGNIAAIRSLSGNRTAYYADTQGGSSGSPVLDYNSNLVVVLHNTGSCSSGNGGIPITNVINDLGNLVPANGIDDGGSPPPPPPTGCSSTINSYPWAKSFETGFGGWTQATGDDLDWTRSSGSTPSNNTGPSNAADGSSYIYVETSGNGTGYPNKTANLVSPCYDLPSAAATLTFDYHMYGASMGTLNLQASTNNGSNWTTLWTRSGDQGNSWQSASVSLASYAGSTVTLRLNATSASSWQSDFAIDKMEISTSSSGGGGGDGGGGGGGSNACGEFGITYANDNTVIVFHKDLGWSGSWNYVCLNGYCIPGERGANGYYYQYFTATLGQTYTIEFKVQDNTTGQYLSGVETVTFTTDQCSTAESLLTENEGPGPLALSLYPNPAGNTLKIAGATPEFEYTIIDKLGRRVLEGKGNTVDLNALTPDVYFLKGSHQVLRFIKQ